MFVRVVLTLLCLAATAGYLDREQKAGRFHRVDELFLDFLVSNTRGRFEKPEGGGDVVLVEMREQERADYAAWPPPPLDWQTLLKQLQTYQPEVLVIATPLNWGNPTPDFAPAVAEALLAFPSVILGIETQVAEATKTNAAFLGDLDSLLPHFQQVDGDLSRAPRLASLITAPDASVRASTELGLLSANRVEDEWRLPYALRDQDRFIPTVLAAALARHSRSPYSGGHRLRLGPGAGAYLQGGQYVPLEISGEFTVPEDSTVPTVNALHLMAGNLVDVLPEEDKAALGKARILVVGTTQAEAPGEPPSLPTLYARALDRLLALPRLRVLTEMEQWIAWGIAGAAALWIVLRVRRVRAFGAGLGLIFAGLVVSYLCFQSNLLWCPPALPTALIAVGMILGRMLGRKEPTAPAETAQETVPQPEATPPAAT
jgi:hypothetical protein